MVVESRISRGLRTFWAGALVLILAVAGLTSTTMAASAAEGDPQFLTVRKSVAPEEVSPGQPFTYTIAVNCSESACQNATLDDALPAELAGYPVQNVNYSPAAATVPRDVTWTVDGETSSTNPASLTADTALHIDFIGPTVSPAGTGLEEGNTFTVTITLQVPDDLTPGTRVITNTAETLADNSAPDADDATITILTPAVIAVDATKQWNPNSQSFSPGQASTIALGVTNASNGPVETLVIQEPQTAADGASALDPSNPFTITDFTGFGDTALPAGADAVQVDLYLKQADGTWTWVPGPPSAELALPSDLDPADVGGIRVTYTGESIQLGATGSVSLNLEQRATQRDTGDDLSVSVQTVDNVVQGTAAVEGRDPVSDTANASYELTPAAIAAATTKDITPSRLAAGDTAAARIVGTNSSDVGVNILRVADLDYFDEDITFGGFTAAPTWPATATAGTLVYHPLDGSADIEIPLVDGAIPALPGVLISGFEIVFTAEDGGIESGSSTGIDFTINTSEDAVAAGAGSRNTTNTATTTVTAQNGVTDDAVDDATLTLLEPAIDVTLTKSIRPSSSVQPGETVVTRLASNLKTTSDYVTARQIVVEDAWTGDGGFWDAFNLRSVASTQVPGNTSLTIQVRGADGTWIDLQVYPRQDEAQLISLSEAQIQALLPGGVDITDVTGIRFTFDNADGFASDTTVTPYVVSEARSDLRSGDPTTPAPDEPVTYENHATTTGTGATEAGTPLTDDDEGVAAGTVETLTGTGPVGIDKHWNQETVAAQSQQNRTTTLSWRVGSGYEEIAITDSAPDAAFGDPNGSVEETVFDAFDLSRLNVINADTEPFSNGWFLRYDSITAVELFIGGQWTAVAVPAAGWIQNGAFVGYALTPQQRADTTGVRILLAENTPAREAAAQAGPSYDPYAPLPGTGVGSGSVQRTFDLTWQIRDQKRSDGAWVTETATYNTADAGVVDNSARIDGTPLAGGDVVSDTDNDTILITNPGPGVVVEKSVSNAGPLYVPREGTDAAGYPTTTFTLQAKNDSVSKASYVRVTDPPACTDSDDAALCQSEATRAGALADPFTADIDWLTADGQGTPFNRFDLKKATISATIPSQVDLDASTVWLLRYESDAYVSEQTTATAVNAASAADLATVVGISVTFQGSDPVTTGGTITAANRLNVVLDTQLRTTIRETGNPQVVAANETVDVANRVFAQSYDPILAEGTATGDGDDVNVVLTGGDINVGATKTIAPNALTEPTRHDPVTVTIGANQGTDPVSTLPPAQVTLTDDLTSSPDFWNSFDFTGLGAINAPAGSDRVSVAVFGPFGADGEPAWVESAATPFAEATVPVDAGQYGDIQGIRMQFSREDGGFFSDVYPTPAWTTATAFTVQLRDTFRDSGDVIDLEDRLTVDNEVVVIADRLNGESSEAREAAATVAMSPGTFSIDVHKQVNDGTSRVANIGDMVPWDLTFTNTGTGYLSITELRDAPPVSLKYLGDEPVYSQQPDGSLPLPEGLSLEGDDLVFTWAQGAQMLPGETFSIRILLELQPGLQTGERAINEFTVSTVENLEQCTDAARPSALTDAWDDDDRTCGTTEYVQPSTSNNLYVVKGVRGERAGAIIPNNPTAICQQNFVATGGAYYRSPCAANSVIGGTDHWILRAQNAGTTVLNEAVLIDQFPVAGDRLLLSGTSRGSQYRPQMLDDLEITAPAGTTGVIEVTFSPDVCVGTYGNLQNQEPCAQNGEQWVLADSIADEDWKNVSGLRISLNFGTAGLNPGAFVDVTYSTSNTVASVDDPSGAPGVVPVDDTFAWNQFGAKFLFRNATSYGKIAPNRVGVHLVTGSIQFSKEVTGDASGYAPDEFRFDVVCTIQGVALDMGELAVVELNSANEYSQRIDGIPFGASCDVTEQGPVGEFGETTRSGSPVTLVVAEENRQGAVPEAQIAVIGNEYAYSGLSVTKTVDTDADQGEFGPFDFTLSCTTAVGTPVVFEGDETELAFTLSDGETFTAPEDTIPARATCLVSEADSTDADEIVIVGDNVTDNRDGTASVLVGTTDAAVEFTNGFNSGVLSVSKVVDGEGASLYGAGPFEFTAVCTYRGQTLLETAFTLDPNGQRTFGVYPTGTSCVVEETATGGATRTAIDPADGTVVISTEEGATNAVIATNTFDLTSIQVDKSVTGDAASFAAAEFRVDVVCSVRGIDVPLGADGVVELNEANGFSSRVDAIPTGADCTVTEQGEVGEFGETGRTGSPSEIDVETVVDDTQDVPASQTASIVNEYTYSGLSVVKRVQSGADAEYGPFEFTLSCISRSGIPVLFDGDVAEYAFTLATDETFTVPEDTIPANSTCLITEVDSAAANSITVASPAVTDLGDGRAEVEVGPDPVNVEYTNVFDAGTLTIQKNVDGAGGELYGNGPFAFTAVCTYRGQTLLDASFVLGAGEETSYGAFPTGTECIVDETNAAGATETAYAPADGTVLITADENTMATVTVTNTFSLSSIEVRKSITGDAAAYASGEFLADVMCTVGGTAVDLGANATVALTAANGFASRIDGIPTGAVCEVTEQGEVGDFGETSRPDSDTTVTVDTVVAADEEVPAEQIAELVNDYAFSGLSVTKRVDAAAEAEYGPFDFTLTCTSATGIPVTFDGGAAELAFTLEADATFTADENTIPARADCLVTEVGGNADSVVVVGDNVTDNGDASASVHVGVTPAAVEFTNGFDAGVLVVQKVVDGEGANLYGMGTFEFTAVCTYDGQTLLDATFSLVSGDTRSFGPYPTNTSCIVEETDAGNATSTAFDPSDGIVAVGAGSSSTVTATNTFDVSSITVTKKVTGDLDADGARGVFTVDLQCTVDGAEFVIPGDAERELRVEGGYQATFSNLPAGADCVIAETETGGAVRTAISVAVDGGSPLSVDGTSADVSAVGDVQVEITNEFVKDLPRTGLVVPPIVWGAIPLVLFAGLALLLAGGRRREEV
ncbi:DUF5979 domain-containing protein [Microbacterium sp. AK031]|uniref:DUF5979 domain-containing protein n=1 Tax=Microbacterium sp. AK031 TaxID=2723076 RepID=UPI002168FC7F|nr:DUF5979 domain-containing protein [Microbacterium sp. AK031]MCS3842849.1 putative repeat protein (TIGR01451 family) [Microbacterium sp. AK031]